MTLYLCEWAILLLAALDNGRLGHCLYADSAQKAPEPPLEPLRLNRSRAGLPDRLRGHDRRPLGFCLPAGNRQPGLGFALLAVLPSCLTPCPGFSSCLFSAGLFVCALSGSIALRHEKRQASTISRRTGFYLLLLAGMALYVACAADAILFLLAWEIMSLSPFLPD